MSTQSNSKKLIILLLILIAVLAISNIYQFLSKSSTIQSFNTQVNDLNSERETLQNEFIVSSSRIDSLTEANINLESKVSFSRDTIKRIKFAISQILKREKLSKAQTDSAKMLIAELNDKIANLAAQVDQLMEANTTLTNQNQELTSNVNTLSSEKQKVLDSLTKSKKESEDLKDLGSTMRASYFKLSAIQEKKNGKTSETTKAKRTNIFRVQFNLDDNPIAESGTKEVYVILISPDGNVISDQPNTFTTRNNEQKNYSDKLSLDYKKGQTTPVSYDRKIAKASKGTYTIQVYQNGFKIGEGAIQLR
ncbi:MAG: hypothetical protein ORN85_08255 [Sediminibacterium sp.]|nr:hypothetical protein [Sediminibacterium sp.]